MTVCLTPTRPPNHSQTIETLVDEILAHGEAGLQEQDLARWREIVHRAYHPHDEVSSGA